MLLQPLASNPLVLGLIGVPPSLAQIIKDRKSLFSTTESILKVRTDRSTADIIHKNKHQNSIYTIRSRGAFKIRGLSLKRQIIAKDTRTPNNQIPLRLRCWMPISAFSELVREHRMETSLSVSYWFAHDSTTRA